MPKVNCPQTCCTDNKDGICTAKEITLFQEPYHAPECTMMYTGGKRK